VTAGPGYVVPQAVFLKIFGNGFWQYRLWPLVSFAGMLTLLFYLTYFLGGLASLLILQIWTWVVPQLYVTFAFEGFGEHIAFLYLLLSFYLIWKASTTAKKNFLMFASGIFFSLSILTKYLGLLTGGAFVAAGAYDLYRSRKAIRKVIIRWGFFLLGVFLPVGLFELYRYLSLTSRFGISGWNAINKDISLHFKINGSGTDFKKIDWAFVSKKIILWSKTGISLHIAPWILLLASPFIYLRKHSRKLRLLFILFLSALAPLLIWYLLLSPTGWVRHVWTGLVMGMVIVSVVASEIAAVKKGLRKVLLIILIIFLGSTIIQSEGYETKFFLDQATIDSWRARRYEGGIQGLPHVDTFSLSDQKKLINYFEENISKEDKVYYLGWFLVAEASPLVDKVFYTVDRYLTLGQINPEGGGSYLILGPYQKGKLSIIGDTYHDRKVAQLCESVAFENPSYTLCTLKTGLIYENRTYD
jgi:hypothetical protein